MNQKPSIMDIHDPYTIIISRRRAAFFVLLAALVGALGFWMGQYALQSRSLHYQSWLKEQNINFHSDNYHFRTFMYNGTFASTSSEETNMAWDSLFPEGMGFIEDPAGISEGAGVSAFHQLHCLNLLRQLHSSEDSDDEDSQQHSRYHAKHCVEYLRQALICAADSTIEPGNATSRHVTGSGVVHECRDFDGLYAWTEQRKLIM
ncbi:hypothetical protein BDR22DRAFT_894522 [Usnea florida]